MMFTQSSKQKFPVTSTYLAHNRSGYIDYKIRLVILGVKSRKKLCYYDVFVIRKY